MESRIARLEEVEEPRKERALRFTIGSAPRSSSVVASLDEVTAVLGSFTLGLASLQVSAGYRIGAPGRTALAIRPWSAPGRPAPPSHRTLRRSVRRSPSARSTRPARHWPMIFPSVTRSRLRCRSEPRRGAHPPREVRPAGRRGHQPPRAPLTGGAYRAAMALLQARGVNLLVLDEPTNHLDLPAIEQLEEALDSYDGRCCSSPTTGGSSSGSASTSTGTSRTVASRRRSPCGRRAGPRGHPVRPRGPRAPRGGRGPCRCTPCCPRGRRAR